MKPSVPPPLAVHTRTSVCLSSRSLLLPAGAGGRHGEHRHLPHLVLPLGPDLARDHEPPPPQQQQQQVDFNHHRRVTSQWCDPQRIVNKGRARGQLFPDLKIPAVSSLSLPPSCSGSAELITKGLTYVIFRHLQRILLLYWHLNYWLGYSGTLLPPARVSPRIYFCVQMRTNVKVKAAACTIQINGNNLDSS